MSLVIEMQLFIFTLQLKTNLKRIFLKAFEKYLYISIVVSHNFMS